MQRAGLVGFAAFALTSCAAQISTQQTSLDPKMYGVWELDVAHSTFGGQEPPPTSGQVNWTEHGLAFAITFPSGGLFTDAMSTDHGCTYIGVSVGLSCEVTNISPRHMRFWLRENGVVRRVGDVELVDDNTEHTVHHVTSQGAAPYDEATTWRRARE